MQFRARLPEHSTAMRHPQAEVRATWYSRNNVNGRQNNQVIWLKSMLVSFLMTESRRRTRCKLRLWRRHQHHPIWLGPQAVAAKGWRATSTPSALSTFMVKKFCRDGIRDIFRWLQLRPPSRNNHRSGQYWVPSACPSWWVAKVQADGANDSPALERVETPPNPSLLIPFSRDTDFVERGTILAQIHQKCAVLGSRTTLISLGGVG
jgi:hypothetical protein